MTNKEYNGWYNYETWLVALWLSNEKESYDFWREQAKELKGSKNEFGTVNDVWLLSARMKDSVEGQEPRNIDGFYSDLLHAAIAEVNFDEIARHYIEEVEK